MFNNFSVVVKTENVDTGIVFIARPLLKAMQHNQVALSQDSLKRHPFPRKLSRHPLEIFDECLLAVTDGRVMLDVFVSNETLDGCSWLRLIKHQIIKRDGILFVFNGRQIGSFAPHGVMRLL